MKVVVRAALLLLLVAAVMISAWSFLPQSGEYAIVSIDTGTWLVTARGEGGDTLSFRMHPSIFQGRCFHANLTGVREGGRFSIVGPPGERFDRIEARAATGKGASADKTPSRGRSRRPSTRGMQRYCITAVDAAQQTATAEADRSGEKIRFKIDSGSFRGYRFRIPSMGDLVAGGRFSLTTPNEVPVRCCTLEERLQ